MRLISCPCDIPISNQRTEFSGGVLSVWVSHFQLGKFIGCNWSNFAFHVFTQNPVKEFTPFWWKIVKWSVIFWYLCNQKTDLNQWSPGGMSLPVNLEMYLQLTKLCFVLWSRDQTASRSHFLQFKLRHFQETRMKNQVSVSLFRRWNFFSIVENFLRWEMIFH